MRSAVIEVSGCVQDFLAVERRGKPIRVEFELPTGLRDLVQSVGIPHVEVGEATVDRAPASWDRIVEDGTRIQITSRYPLAGLPPDPRFVLDGHLGRLARDLRLLGFDTWHRNQVGDADLVEVAGAERRILLTRDRGLLMRSAVVDGSWVRATDPFEQTVEVIRRFRLADSARPFTRCLVCGGVLMEVSPNEVAGEIPAEVGERHTDFRCCDRCGRIYWRGTHHADLASRLEAILAASRS
jgi:hypothetical protein